MILLQIAGGALAILGALALLGLIVELHEGP